MVLGLSVSPCCRLCAKTNKRRKRKKCILITAGNIGPLWRGEILRIIEISGNIRGVFIYAVQDT